MNTSIAALILLVIFLMCVCVELSKKNDELKARQYIETVQKLKVGDRILCRDRTEAMNLTKALKDKNYKTQLDVFNDKYSILIVR